MTEKLTFNSWIVCPKPNPQACFRLFCFPCAGGGVSAYSTWSDNLPSNVEVCSIQLPGRGGKITEPPFTRLAPLVQHLIPILQPHLNIKFAFLGHSVGALIGFEVARQLYLQGFPSPVHLFICSCPAPQIPALKPHIHALPEAAFVAELCHRYNAIPQKVLESHELMQLLLSSLRADFAIFETYVYETKKQLNCPISVFGGLQDNVVKYEDLAAWCRQTSNVFKLQLFAGDHFFLHSHRSPFLQVLSQQLIQLNFQFQRIIDTSILTT